MTGTCKALILQKQYLKRLSVMKKYLRHFLFVVCVCILCSGCGLKKSVSVSVRHHDNYSATIVDNEDDYTPVYTHSWR